MKTFNQLLIIGFVSDQIAARAVGADVSREIERAILSEGKQSWLKASD